MNLQLLICTIDDRIARVPAMLLPPTAGISYVVSWQRTAGTKVSDVPKELLMRPDLKLASMAGRGLSRNRNNALDRANGDVCLVCDDDCHYELAQLQQLAATFAGNPTLDVAAFMMNNTAQPKSYPSHSFGLGKYPKGYYITSMELAFRPASLRKAGLRWDERWGIGSAQLGCGEEELLVRQAVRAGLDCRFFPITVVTTHAATTGQAERPSAAVLRGKGAWMLEAYPHTALLRAVLTARRLAKRHGMPMAGTLRHLLHGISYWRKQRKQQ